MGSLELSVETSSVLPWATGVPSAPIVLGPNQPERFYRGGAGIARFRGTPQPSEYVPEDWVASATEIFGQPGAASQAP